MKFTKILAISLSAMGAMQLMNAKTIPDIKINKDMTTLTQNAGDTLTLNIPENGTTGFLLSVIEPTPTFLTVTKGDFTQSPTCKPEMKGCGGTRQFTVTLNTTPTNEPLIIQNMRDWSGEIAKTYTINFKATAAAPEKSTKKAAAIDVDLTKQNGDIDLIKVMQTAGINKAMFEPGDMINLKLTENRTTDYQLIITSLPSTLDLIESTYQAPQKEGGRTGVAGTRILRLEITPNIAKMVQDEVIKPLIISYAKPWEQDRPETYKINFQLKPLAISIPIIDATK